MPAEPLAIVGGCGHVGLPLGLAFALKGRRVDLIDVSLERIALVRAGRMPFHEDGGEEALATSLNSGLINVTDDLHVIQNAAAIIVTIGTPVDEYLDPRCGNPIDHPLIDSPCLRARPSVLAYDLGQRYRVFGTERKSLGVR
jgi:hypothetical protein